MNSRGYSLLEVMISMVVLAIAFLALIATQLGALSGYVSARDASTAAELGRRTAELLRIQGSQWVVNVGDPMVAPPTYSGVDAYDPSERTPFDRSDTIQDILDASPDWLALVDDPVDIRFNRANTDSPEHLGGKFCIYARGAPMAGAFQDVNDVEVVASIRFQIAVVYPGPRATLLDCTLGNPITDVLLNDVGNNTGGVPALENIGMRVAYFGTLIVRHAHLAP